MFWQIILGRRVATVHVLFHSLGKQRPGSQAPGKPTLKKGTIFRLSVRLGSGPTWQVDTESEASPDRLNTHFSRAGTEGHLKEGAVLGRIKLRIFRPCPKAPHVPFSPLSWGPASLEEQSPGLEPSKGGRPRQDQSGWHPPTAGSSGELTLA